MTNQPIDLIGDIYKPLLATIDINCKDDGNLERDFLGETSKVEITGRSLLMPVDAVLSQLNQETSIAFHPLSENIARGDSAVMHFMRYAIAFSLSARFSLLLSSLATVVANKDLHELFTSEQMPILGLLDKTDPKTAENLSSVITKFDADNQLVKVYLKRGGVVDGVNYNRVANVSFPALKDLKENKGIWVGKGIRKKDHDEFLKLVNYVLPDWDKPHTYSGVSDSMSAPGFTALVNANIKLLTRFNELVDTYESIFKKAQGLSAIVDLRKDLSFAENIKRLPKYENLIPPLDGNVGEVDGKAPPAPDQVKQPKSFAPAPVSAPTTQVQQSNTQQGQNMQFNPNQSQPQTQVQPQQQQNTVQSNAPEFVGWNNGQALYRMMDNSIVPAQQWNNQWYVATPTGNIYVTAPPPPPMQQQSFHPQGQTYQNGGFNNGGYQQQQQSAFIGYNNPANVGGQSNYQYSQPAGHQDAISSWNNNYQQQQGQIMFAYWQNGAPYYRGQSGAIMPAQLYNGQWVVVVNGNGISVPPPPNDPNQQMGFNNSGYNGGFQQQQGGFGGGFAFKTK